MKPSFRQQTIVRSFAFGFAASCALAGCASDGSIKPSTQQQLVRACDNAQTAVTLAGFFTEKMTPGELKVFDAAQIAVPKVCSPSALAADLTPAALSANIAALGQIVQALDTVSGAAPAVPALPASEAQRT